MYQAPAGQSWGQPPAAEGSGGGASFSDFLLFRWMITPALITVLWLVSVVAITLLALVGLGANPLAAVLGWVFLMLWARVLFEVMIILFRINDGIQTMARRGSGSRGTYAPATVGGPLVSSAGQRSPDANLPLADLSHAEILGTWIVLDATRGNLSARDHVDLALTADRLLLVRGIGLAYAIGLARVEIVVADDLFVRLMEDGEPLATLDWESGMHGRALAKRVKAQRG